jgi:formylglycine-generating enzyme required for sulfatase activity
VFLHDCGCDSDDAIISKGKMGRFASLFLITAFLVIAMSACVPGPSEGPHLGDSWARPADKMVLVYVPGGKFEMGSTDGDPDEQPVHTVALDGFWVDQTEVTNAQFVAFLNARGNQEEGGVAWLDLQDDDCLIERAGGEFRPKRGYADHPVIEVSWYGAAAYCEWVGSRLPTEAEWEYAARVFDCLRGNFREGSPCRDGYVKTAPVGSFPAGASWCDALDMAGNVWEWVADWYGYGDYSSGPQVSPTGPSSGQYRVQRGGSFHFVLHTARGANRNSHRPVYTDYNGGFRCVRGSE